MSDYTKNITPNVTLHAHLCRTKQDHIPIWSMFGAGYGAFGPITWVCGRNLRREPIIAKRMSKHRMSYLKDFDVQYGNLMSYKYYTRPEAYRLYGSSSANITKHQQGMQEILQIMFANGACTTWKIAKLRLRTSNISLIRTKEKEYRRLFLGRYDTKKRSGGMLDVGLVVREKVGSYNKYRLSLHGILYCIDVLNPSNGDFDCMVQKYADVLPRIFGRWETVKSVAGEDAYKICVLAKGLLLNNPNVAKTQSDVPLYELMSFIHIKYSRNFESISEADLAEQVSYWFYTFLLYYKEAGPRSEKTRARINRVKMMLLQDTDLSEWYREFFCSATSYYKKRLRALANDSTWIIT